MMYTIPSATIIIRVSKRPLLFMTQWSPPSTLLKRPELAPLFLPPVYMYIYGLGIADRRHSIGQCPCLALALEVITDAPRSDLCPIAYRAVLRPRGRCWWRRCGAWPKRWIPRAGTPRYSWLGTALPMRDEKCRVKACPFWQT